MRKEIQQFAQAMEAKCAAHDKDRGDGWRAASVDWLLQCANSEIGELQEALEDCDFEAAMMELVDVANFLMFAYSKLAAQDVKEIRCTVCGNLWDGKGYGATLPWPTEEFVHTGPCYHARVLQHEEDELISRWAVQGVVF